LSETGSKGLLGDVAEAARLAEGAEGVRRILRSVFRNGPVPIRDVARDVSLPVPVVAAVRGELEKRSVLERRGGGLSLTCDGERHLRDLGITSRERLFDAAPYELPVMLTAARETFAAIASERPDVDVTLDQSHATADTALRRAAYLFDHDALEGRRLLIVGDDDLTSVAVAIAAAELEIRVDGVTVVEVDARLCAFLREASRAYDTQVDVHAHDLREPLDGSILGLHDVFFTDPPYTLEGLSLFVSRGVQGLRAEPGKQGFISFGSRRPEEAVTAARTLADTGLAPVEIVPDFNRYVGAQLLAGSSQMIRTVFTGKGSPPVAGAYDGPLYTADRRGARRPRLR